MTFKRHPRCDEIDQMLLRDYVVFKSHFTKEGRLVSRSLLEEHQYYLSRCPIPGGQRSYVQQLLDMGFEESGADPRAYADVCVRGFSLRIEPKQLSRQALRGRFFKD